MKHKLRYEEQPKTFFIRVITLFFTKSENFTQQVHNIDVFGKYSNYFEKNKRWSKYIVTYPTHTTAANTKAAA